MVLKNNYMPPDPHIWRGRESLPEHSCFFQIIKVCNLLTDTPKPLSPLSFALVGFKCDEGVKRNGGRAGAAEGPDALRESLGKLPVQKSNITCYDVGDVLCLDENLEAAQMALAEIIAKLLSAKIIPIVLGGGHELAWSQYQGIKKLHEKEHLGIINFDAHLDMDTFFPKNKRGSATVFADIAQAQQEAHERFDFNCVGVQHAANIHQMFENAKKYQTKIILADELHEGQQQKCVDFIDRAIDQNKMIYLSIALDVFSAAFAPGVSAVQPLGVTPWDVIPLIRQIASSGKVITYDIVELCPRYDINHFTAKLAASLIYEIIHHHSQEPRLW